MPDILHRVGIDAKPDKVFAALTTIRGLGDWWVSDTKGNADPIRSERGRVPAEQGVFASLRDLSIFLRPQRQRRRRSSNSAQLALNAEPPF